MKIGVSKSHGTEDMNWVGGQYMWAVKGPWDSAEDSKVEHSWTWSVSSIFWMWNWGQKSLLCLVFFLFCFCRQRSKMRGDKLSSCIQDWLNKQGERFERSMRGKGWCSNGCKHFHKNNLRRHLKERSISTLEWKPRHIRTAFLGQTQRSHIFPPNTNRTVFGLCTNLKEKSILYFLPVSNVTKTTIL